MLKEETRNIIFVGSSRSGKTTSIAVLKDRDYSPGLFTIVRDTKNSSFHSFKTRFNASYNNLELNIMDTPGLFERSLNKSDERTNELILDMIGQFINEGITHLNHIYFVMSIRQGLNKDDLKAFKLFRELFVGMEEKISIIVSFAQTLKQEDYDHYINQFIQVPELKPIYEAIDERIFFLGAAQKNEMYNMDTIKETVYKQRYILLKHIYEQKDAFDIQQLKLYQQYLVSVPMKHDHESENQLDDKNGRDQNVEETGENQANPCVCVCDCEKQKAVNEESSGYKLEIIFFMIFIGLLTVMMVFKWFYSSYGYPQRKIRSTNYCQLFDNDSFDTTDD